MTERKRDLHSPNTSEQVKKDRRDLSNQPQLNLLQKLDTKDPPSPQQNMICTKESTAALRCRVSAHVFKCMWVYVSVCMCVLEEGRSRAESVWVSKVSTHECKQGKLICIIFRGWWGAFTRASASSTVIIFSFTIIISWIRSSSLIVISLAT